MKCPGLDMRYWKEGDIFEIPCPKCKNKIEFFKDDNFRKCSKCKREVFNPIIKTDCLQYCEFAETCMELIDR